jgi:23S rRNA pseudouridine2605 synthase
MQFPIRLNKFLAHATGLSRRGADAAISSGRVTLNGRTADLGQSVGADDAVALDGRTITPPVNSLTLILNKPAGYVCSREGQGSKTVYDLLPAKYRALQSVGRLDKDSSGLLVMTTDGQLHYELTHPSFQKEKVYQVTLDRALQPGDEHIITSDGVTLDDGPSKLGLRQLSDGINRWQVTMREGRNRQIRRTFGALGYTVVNLHRVQFGEYVLEGIEPGEFREV